MCRPAIALIGFLAVLGVPLPAEGPLIGVQFALAQPQSDLDGGKWLHGRAGASAGAHVLFDLDAGHAINLRGDATFYRSGRINLRDANASTLLYGETAKARILAVGADYNYFFMAQRLEGPYLLLGAGWSRADLTHASQVSGPPVSTWLVDQRASAFQYALGLGCRFLPQVAGEFRFTHSNFHNLAVAGTLVRAPALTLGVMWDY